MISKFGSLCSQWFGIALILIVVVGCGSAKKEKAVEVVAGLGQPIENGKTSVYCGTFQLAWNELMDEMGGDIQLSGGSDLANELNKQGFTASDISEDCFVALAGEAGSGIVDKIKKSLAEKFPKSSANLSDITGSGLVAFAYLEKNLQFEEPFERPEKRMLSFPNEKGKEVPIEAFGIGHFDNANTRHLKLSDQVQIFDYQSDDDFIISLVTSSSEDELVLAKIDRGKTLVDTFHEAERRIAKGGPEAIRYDETLMIPVINFDISHPYDELLNKKFVNPEWSQYQFVFAAQDIRFRLDERGSILKSQAEMVVDFNGHTSPREFNFDRPFLLYLKSKGSKVPYFAMWVGSTEFLKLKSPTK